MLGNETDSIHPAEEGGANMSLGTHFSEQSKKLIPDSPPKAEVTSEDHPFF